jgi:Flp pilus assembly protein TadB
MTVLYGAYLFARTWWRARGDAVSDSEARRRQSRDGHFFALYILIGLAVAVVLPIAGIVKVILVVMFVGGTVVAMAARVDPPRRGRR